MAVQETNRPATGTRIWFNGEEIGPVSNVTWHNLDSPCFVLPVSCAFEVAPKTSAEKARERFARDIAEKAFRRMVRAKIKRRR